MQWETNSSKLTKSKINIEKKCPIYNIQKANFILYFVKKSNIF